MFVSFKVSVVAGVALMASLAHADSFSSFAPLPGSTPGLLGQFWNTGGQQLNSIADGDAYVATNPTPTVTFDISEIFTNNVGDGIVLDAYLNGNGVFATNFSTDPTAFGVNRDYFIFSGFLVVPTAGTWNLATLSDDGSQILINGTVVVDNDFTHGSTLVSNSATFLDAGLYSFTVKFFENDGGTQVQVLADKTGGTDFTPLGGSDFVQSSMAPEPATAGFAAFGLAAAWICARRRK